MGLGSESGPRQAKLLTEMLGGFALSLASSAGEGGLPFANLANWHGPSWPLLGGLSLVGPEREVGHCPRLPPTYGPAMCACACVGLPGPSYHELSGIWGRPGLKGGGQSGHLFLAPLCLWCQTGGKLAEPGGGRTALVDFVGQGPPPQQGLFNAPLPPPTPIISHC